MPEDTNLRKLLTNFRETVIYADYPPTDESRKHGILRRAMIDWIITNKPTDVADLYFGLPDRLKKNTDPVQLRKYAPVVLAIVRRHTQQRHHLRVA